MNGFISVRLDAESELEEILPPMEDFLEAPELSTLTGQKSFQYLFKLGYEYIRKGSGVV